MNILQILPELRVGGVERGTVDLATHLVKAGHKAVVISNGGDLVKDLVAAGVVHYQLPVHRKSLFSMIAMVPKIVDIIRKERIDIVHARSRIPAWSAFFASRKVRVHHHVPRLLQETCLQFLHGMGPAGDRAVKCHRAPYG
jgi:hypothetical protein